MNELVRTRIVTKQLFDSGETQILNSDFAMLDLLIDSDTEGQVTVYVSDGENLHIICVLRGRDRFNHTFNLGWRFWRGAKLYVAKESDLGEVNIAVGYAKISGEHYSTWRS